MSAAVRGHFRSLLQFPRTPNFACRTVHLVVLLRDDAYNVLRIVTAQTRLSGVELCGSHALGAFDFDSCQH